MNHVPTASNRVNTSHQPDASEPNAVRRRFCKALCRDRGGGHLTAPGRRSDAGAIKIGQIGTAHAHAAAR